MSEFNKILNKKAVALKYDEDNKRAPVIVASGKGYTAEKIVELANANDVPVYEDNSLASVLSQLELGREIPEELYKTVVDIYVYFLQFVTKKEDGDGNIPPT
ncbi:MAG: EscU/YscU/HrcU family type III secretion system export apparatus switch protein [Hungatella sp.]